MSEITVANRLQTLEREILERKGRIAENILEIGDRLIEAKGMMPHGDFQPWLQNNVGFSDRTARNFMQAARAFPAGKRKAISDLTSTSIILIAQQPAERREELLDNPDIAKLSTRELKALIASTDKEPKANILTEPIFTPEMRQYTDKILASGDLSLLTAWHGFLKEMLQGESEIIIDLECKIGDLLSTADGQSANIQKYSGIPFEIAIEDLKAYPGYDEFLPIMHREGEEYTGFVNFMRKWGFNPIWITKGNIVIDGHERIRVAKDLGLKTLMATYIPLLNGDTIEAMFYREQMVTSTRTSAFPFFSLLYHIAIGDTVEAKQAWKMLNELDDAPFIMKVMPILKKRGFIPS